MANSLVTFSRSMQERDGQKLFWGRADLDGVPYRGPQPPIMPEEEYAERVVKVGEAHADFFDMMVPRDKARYLEVLTACCNGWFRCLERIPFWNKTTKHYMEWVEYFMEDGTRIRFAQNQALELDPGGPPNLHELAGPRSQ